MDSHRIFEHITTVLSGIALLFSLSSQRKQVMILRRMVFNASSGRSTSLSTCDNTFGKRGTMLLPREIGLSDKRLFAVRIVALSS